MIRSYINSGCVIQPGGDRKGGLYMGNLKGAKDLKTLREYNINAIASIMKHNLKYPKGLVKSHLTVEAEDLNEYNLK